MTLLHGDCLEQLKSLPDNSVDSLVTDPPAGISFMGKSWDSDKGGRLEWIAWLTLVMSECKRVMKPGAHGLVWAIPRTSHWTATACEEAGFEIRDVVTHLFGSGFPKSLDVSKAIDKAAGAERAIIGTKKKQDIRGGSLNAESKVADTGYIDVAITAPATDDAKRWSGWGTGAINIDGSRVGTNPGYSYPNGAGGSSFGVGKGIDGTRSTPVASTQGRFPANLVLSHTPYCDDDQCDIECAIAMLDE